MSETIISCAVTGNLTTRDHHPQLPVTPIEIAEACIRAVKAGASIVHIHVRDPVTGEPSMNLAYYKEVVDVLRSSGTDMVINLTTGPGARYLPSIEDRNKGAPGSNLLSRQKKG